MENAITSVLKGKKVLFITTKNIDYIRNVQEINLISRTALETVVISSTKRNYFLRIVDVLIHISHKKVKECDVIFVGFAPQLIVPFFLYRLKKKTLVIDFFISVYDTFVCDRRLFQANSILGWFCHKLDEFTLRKADYVVCDTNSHGEFFSKEFCVNSRKITTVYLEANKNIFYPKKEKKPKDLEGKFVVLYFGSILPLQGVDVILRAIEYLPTTSGIYFELIGPISDKYTKPVQDNIFYYDWLPQEELSSHVAYADLCLAGHFCGTIEKANRTIPGKAFIYESMGKRMILSDSDANRELFFEDDRHVFVKRGDSIELARIILEQFESNSFSRE